MSLDESLNAPLNISVLYLEKNGTMRTFVTSLLLKRGFKAKSYGTLHSAVRFTKLNKYDLIIAHLRFNEYEPLFKQAKEQQIALAIAPSSTAKYQREPAFQKIINSDYDVLTFKENWYKNIKPEDFEVYVKKKKKQ
jgi:hypothetical protein